MQQIFLDCRNAILPYVGLPQPIPEMNVGICGIQGLEYWGWIGYEYHNSAEDEKQNAKQLTCNYEILVA